MTYSNAQASVAFLSGADDLLSRLLLDYSIFEEPKINGRSTGKINKHARELRITDNEVENAKMLVKGLRSGSVGLDQGLKDLLSLPSVDSFVKKWDDVPLFSNHAKRYILAFRPDCGIAFHETDRYKNPRAGVTARAKKNLAAVTSRRDPATFIEVGVFATRDFKKGDLINLRGGIADLTEEEDDEMRLSGGRSDFSVLWSERKNCFCLLLGPARFVNHDCRNNVEFNLVGSNMSFKALEDIKKDEEIFTHYGAHYFETDNAACLCATCEQLKQGAFTPLNKRKKAEVEPTEETPEATISSSARSRRNSSPGPGPHRSSSRASRLPAVNYNENAPVASTSASAVAQKAIAKSKPISRSTSLGSITSRPRPPSSRVIPVRGALSVVDALRSQPRLVVQPKLAPPPGYKKHYSWDTKKKVAKYVGPQTCTNEEDQKSKVPKKGRLSIVQSASTSSLSKRRRLDSDSPAPASSPRAKAPTPKRPRTASVVPPKKFRVGERRSGRLSSTTASTKTSGKRKQDEVDEDSSELSEEDEEESEEEAEDEEETSDLSDVEASPVEEEERVEEKPKVVQDKGKGKELHQDVEMVERSNSPVPFALPRTRRDRTSSTARSASVARSVASDTPASSASGNAHLRTVTLDLGFSTSTPIEEDVSTPFALTHGSDHEADAEKDGVEPCPVPDSGKKGEPHPPDKPHHQRRISSPNFYAQNPTEGGEGANGGNKQTGESSFCEAPSSAVSSGRGSYSQAARAQNGSNGVGNGGGGSGGDEDDERNRKRNEPRDKMDIEGEKENGEEEEEDKKPVVNGTGEEGGVVEDPQDAVAALLMLYTAPDSSDATPEPNPATNSASSAASSSAQVASGPRTQSNVRRGKRVARPSEPEAPALVRTSSNPRSTRRQSKLDEDPAPLPAPSPPRHKTKKARIASPVVSESSEAEEEEPAPRPRSNIRWGKGKPGQRPANLPPRPSNSIAAPPQPQPQPRSVAKPSLPSPKRARPISPELRGSPPPIRPEPRPAPAPTGRRTRSKPIPGRLEDVLSAPETLAATGGYDWEKGRYISKHEQLRAPSSNPRPERRETDSPSPPPSPRRRRSVPSAPPPPAPAPAITSRRSDSPAHSKPLSKPPLPPARRRVSHSPIASTSRALLSPNSPAAPPEGVRATRRSFPIAAPLREVIYSSSALAATGGWCETSQRYVGASAAPETGATSTSTPNSRASTSGIKRPRSSTPRVPLASTSRPSAPTPPSQSNTPDSARSTRRSNPINQRIDQLVYSSAVGGWSEKEGKYISAVAARKAASTGGSTPKS